MNIICNNCVGARLYETTGVQFNNPFMWSITEHKHYINLVKKFESINFSNVKFSLEYYNYKDRQNVFCNIDDTIQTHFTHYIYDTNLSEPTKRGLDIMYENILKYTNEKYFSRLSRMNESPIFVYSFNGFKFSDEEYAKRFNDILKIKDKPIHILAYKSKGERDNISNNIKVIYLDDAILNGTTGSVAKNSYKQIINYEE